MTELVTKDEVLALVEEWAYSRIEYPAGCSDLCAAIHALPAHAGQGEVEIEGGRSEEVALEHGFTREQYRAAKAIEHRIFGPYQWQNQGDRAASMFVQICQALKDEADRTRTTQTGD